MSDFQGRRDTGDSRGGSYQNNRPRPMHEETVQIKVPPFDSPNLLGDDAETLARTVVQNTGLTTSQIRNFYSEVKNIERLIDVNEDAWVNNFNRIKLIKAKAIYNKNRDKNANRAFGPFSEFLGQSIDRIKNDETGRKTFKIFCQLFEAFVGYSTQYAKNQ